MKLTKERLKQIIKEELREARGVSGQKAYSTERAAASLDKMNTALRSMDPTFKKDPDLRIKYENALAAVSALHFAVSAKRSTPNDGEGDEPYWSPFD